MLRWQGGDQGPDRVVVGAQGIALQQWPHEHALTGCGEGLAVGLECAGANGVGAGLQIDRHLTQMLHAWVVERGQGRFWLTATQRELGGQSVGVDLFVGLELIHLDLLKDACRATRVVLAGGQIGSGQAQQGSLVRRLGSSGLLEQLLDAGVGCAWQFAKAGGGRTGASGQQGSQAEGR